MRTLFRGAAIASLALLIVSCGLLKKKGEEADAAAEAAVAEVADAAPAPPPPAIASNEDDVARFPDETKLDDVAATFQKAYNVREAPPAGTIVAGLPKGTNVTQIASRTNYFLILFDDPAAAGEKKMGWVHADAFSATVIKEVKCPAGETALVSGLEAPFCGKVCNVDTDCPGGQACKGSANKYVNGKAGAAVKVCTVFHPHDAGAPPAPVATDAGLATNVKKDGGLFIVTKDAGAPAPPTPPVPAPNVIVTAPPCPVGFTSVAKTGKCHRQCAPGAAGVVVCGNFPCSPCENKHVCLERRDQCK